MGGLRIWHLMIVVIAAAVFFAAARFESPCTPVSPILFASYVCGLLGILGARRRGRRSRTGLWLGLLLGPLGVIVAWSNPIPDDRLEPEEGSPAGV